ncbi:MAG: hypothetical protein ACXWUP_01715 [Allosphingosinicella sp.]
MSVGSILGVALTSPNAKQELKGGLPAAIAPASAAAPEIGTVRVMQLAPFASGPGGQPELRISMRQISPMSDTVRTVTLEFPAGSLLAHLSTEPSEERAEDRRDFAPGIVPRSAEEIVSRQPQAMQAQANLQQRDALTLLRTEPIGGPDPAPVEPAAQGAPNQRP